MRAEVNWRGASSGGFLCCGCVQPRPVRLCAKPKRSFGQFPVRAVSPAPRSTPGPRSKAPHGTLTGRRHSVAHLCGLGLNDTGAAPSDSLRPASVPNTVPSRSQRPLAAIYPTTRHTIDAGQGQFELPVAATLLNSRAADYESVAPLQDEIRSLNTSPPLGMRLAAVGSGTPWPHAVGCAEVMRHQAKEAQAPLASSGIGASPISSCAGGYLR